ncbi:MAG TPA: SH3 domain-containing protein [Sphingomicrobium sp.]
MAKHRPTRTSGESFSLTGPSNLPNPEFNAYRRDLADIALASEVIASHYVAPVERHVSTATALRSNASEEAGVVCMLRQAEIFAMLDDSVGWAWGYAGEQRRVGYVRSDSLSD